MEQGISINQVRVLYEIALAIGNRQDLNKILKYSIISYIRKLNFTGAFVVHLHRRNHSAYKVIHEFSLPYVPEVKNNSLRFIREMPAVLSEAEYRSIISQGIQCRHIENGECRYTFNLSDFGLLMLTRRIEPFGEEALNIILELNRKVVFITPILKGMTIAGFHGVEHDMTGRKLYESRVKLSQPSNRISVSANLPKLKVLEK